MASDPTSPVAPARINALILPVGRVRKRRFQAFVERIRKEDAVRLGDISPDTSSDKTTFSPVAFPNGCVLYNFTQSLPPEHHLSFSPFEIFREPLLILCVADHTETFRPTESTLKEQGDSENYFVSLKIKLETEMQAARDQFPRALHVQLIIFDAEDSTSAKYLPRGTKRVPPPSHSTSTVMKTIMCDVSAILLAEMSLMTSSIQQAAALVTPGASADSFLGDKRSSSPSLEGASTIASRKDRVSSIPPASSRALNDEIPSMSDGEVNTSRPSSPADSDYTVSTGQKGDSPSEMSPRGSFSDLPNRPRTADLPLGAKRDRKSMHASTVPADRARVKLKARQGLLLGSLFLHSGRWPDALRELGENCTRAKAFADNRWLAKGLENILVTMLLLARAGMEFTIPSICYIHSEKFSTGKQPSSSNNGITADIRPATDSGNKQTLLKLSSAIPEIVKNIMSSHARADVDTEGTFPRFILSDCIVRLARLYAFLYRSWGTLDKRTLEAITSSNPKYSAFRHPPQLGSSAHARRREISFLLFRAYPTSNDRTTEMEATEDVIILSRITSVLSFTGLERKQAMANRDLLSILIPSFIQARKRGAAEMGIHPAASLSMVQTFQSNKTRSGEEIQKAGQERSLRSLINFMFRTYGVQVQERRHDEEQELLQNNKGPGNYAEPILRDAWLDSFGSIGIKSDILRLCTNLTEALPDFEEALHSISTTFSTVGPTKVLPLPIHTNLSGSLRSLVLLPEDEQIRLAAKFYRLVESLTPSDIVSIETAYWDRFLLRNIELDTSSNASTLFSRQKSQFTGSIDPPEASKQSRGPFLHDAFGRAYIKPLDQILVAGEMANFLLTFQNPYSFEIFIEHLTFITEGVVLERSLQSFPLGPCVMGKVMVSAVPAAGGKLKILGCRIKIRGCRIQTFLMFREHWSSADEVKFKQVGLSSLAAVYDSNEVSRSLEAAAESKTRVDDLAPVASTVSFTVIPKQPILEVIASSFPQSNVTLLAGQTVSYLVTLRNLSANTTCDFVSVSFKQTVHHVGSFNPTMGTKDTGAFTLRAENLHEQISIAPGESKVFKIEILGVPGLTEGFVFFDYACIEGPLDDAVDKFYTRQIKLDLQITVNSTIDLLRADAIPLKEYSGAAEDILKALVRSNTGRPLGGAKKSILRPGGVVNQISQSLMDFDMLEEQGVFVLLLDVRNLWTRPLRITFYLNHENPGADPDLEHHSSLLCSQNIVQAGQITRIALAMPRIFTNEAFMDLKKTHENYNKTHPIHVRSSRANSLHSNEDRCRAALLKRIKGVWEDVSNTGSLGLINLQGLRLTPRMMDTILQKELNLDLTLTDGIKSQSGSSELPIFKANQLLIVAVTLTNNTSRPLDCALQLNPLVSGKAGVTDMARHVAWTGSLERHVPSLEGGQYVRVSTGVTFLSPGRYEIVASAHALKYVLRKTDMGEAESLFDANPDSQMMELLGSSVAVINIGDEED